VKAEPRPAWLSMEISLDQLATDRQPEASAAEPAAG